MKTKKNIIVNLVKHGIGESSHRLYQIVSPTCVCDNTKSVI